MPSYIARSALATSLLEIAQSREPGITGLWLEFSTPGPDGANWRVSKIEIGAASELAARTAIEEAVRENGGWHMVEDGDPRDGVKLRDDGPPGG